MTNEQKQVKEWMQKFGQETPDKPFVPHLYTRKLRARLILEEALECIEALGFRVTVTIDKEDLHQPLLWRDDKKSSLPALADGLADLHYVAYCGTAVACGIDMEPVFQEVHRSNMTKIWPDGTVHKDEYGKVIKPPTYSPANIIL